MADSAVRAVLGRPFNQQVAFFRGKLGRLVPTERWTDLQRQAHDKAFMVAGAQGADLLAGLAAAVDRAITEGVGIDAFRKDFAALVEREGWSYRGGFNWRTRTIYRTNIATSYAAGRLAQLRAEGFSHFVYKHGGSADPRPQHLAWDGLVLPADHPFWASHYPPNGWGCSCRVVGVRNAAGARRVGGNPNKALPDGWDQRDPKTGAPKGIDAGWDYAPGDTVSDAVNAMASKATQWEYTLAKSYMQGVPETVRDRLAEAYRAIPSVADDTRRYAQQVIENNHPQGVAPYRTLGLLTKAQAATVTRALGRDVDGFDWALDRYAPLHIHGNHGDPRVEEPRGQRAIVAADYERLPEMLNAPDVMRADGDEWVVEKTFGSERFVAIYSMQAKRRMMNLKSLRVVVRTASRSTS